MVDPRFFAFFKQNLDHIEAPWEMACFEKFEPSVGTAFDELALGFVDRIERAYFGVTATGFNFHKEQQAFLSRDDVDLATARTFEISFEDSVAIGAEEINRDALTVLADPEAVACDSVSPRQAAGRVEPPAETSDDGGDKGRVSEVLQGVLSCHNPGVSQSRIAETRGLFPS